MMKLLKTNGVSSGDNLFAFIRRLLNPKGLPNFFRPQMSLFFKNLIRQISALLFLDDTFLKCCTS